MSQQPSPGNWRGLLMFWLLRNREKQLTAES
jgi:hypothetical protein